MATVVTGDKTVLAENLNDILAAIDPSGESVVTLLKDVSSDAAINLPYSCTLDLNGHTVRTNPSKGNGFGIAAAGSRNQTTTVKNGRLVHYEIGIRVNAGALVVDNMTIDSYNGAPVAFYGTAATQNVIKNSKLSSKNWGCVSFNKKNTDFSGEHPNGVL